MRVEIVPALIAEYLVLETVILLFQTWVLVWRRIEMVWFPPSLTPIGQILLSFASVSQDP